MKKKYNYDESECKADNGLPEYKWLYNDEKTKPLYLEDNFFYYEINFYI